VNALTGAASAHGSRLTASSGAGRGAVASPPTTTCAGPGSGPITIGPLTPGSLATGTSLSSTLAVSGQSASTGASHRLGARRANRPVRSASSAAAVMTRPAWLFGGWLLRDGYAPCCWSRI